MDQLADDGGLISIVAVDHRASMENFFRQVTGSADPNELRAFRLEVCRWLAPHVSSILVDVGTAHQAITLGLIPRSTGVVCPLEAENPVLEDGLRLTMLDPEFEPEDARRLGAAAVKLLIHDRPDVDRAVRHHKEVLGAAIQQCQDADTPLIVETVPYRLPDETEEHFREVFPELVIEGVRNAAREGVDVLKVAYPGGPRPFEACQLIDELAGPTPWVLLGGLQPLDELLDGVQMAVNANASGCIVGRSIWGPSVNMTFERRQRFLQHEATEKLDLLRRVVQKRGMPWRTRAGLALPPVP
jgi:tagatose-1,6-bisphosphate aldolase